MRWMLFILLATGSLDLAAPEIATAGSFALPLPAQASAVLQDHSTSQATNQTTLQRSAFKNTPRFRKPGGFDHRFPRHIHLLTPYYRDKIRYVSSPNRPLYEEPVYTETLVLDPEIFDPAPQLPEVMIIEDGEVVDVYRGY